MSAEANKLSILHRVQPEAGCYFKLFSRCSVQRTEQSEREARYSPPCSAGLNNAVGTLFLLPVRVNDMQRQYLYKYLSKEKPT